MIISRSIPADWANKRIPYRTTGIYGHFPKFWSCKNYDWTYRATPWALRYDMDEYIAEMRTFYADQEKAHSYCKIKWHMSYVGYLRLILKSRSITLWYMGNPYRHKIIEHYVQK